jgi:hypothetical protein
MTEIPLATSGPWEPGAQKGDTRRACGGRCPQGRRLTRVPPVRAGAATRQRNVLDR